MNTKEFPMDRYKHCYFVGRKMYEYAKNTFNWSEEKAQEMFVLGNLHDIGYEFNSDSPDGLILSNILEKNGYKYFKEIRYHAKFEEKYSTEELDLLYYADLTVDSKGNYVSFEERLKDIISRYGKNSKYVKETEELISYLKRKGFV